MGIRVLAADLSLYADCRSCDLRCVSKYHQECKLSLSPLRVVKLDRSGIAVPLFCLSCGEAFCGEICPTKAIQRDEKIGALVGHLMKGKKEIAQFPWYVYARDFLNYQTAEND